ncbi:MAG TPA: pyruvate dehydrogenase (acetyl-transferring), homodimeric type [Actinomycetes bacterium]|nr:pyruvate dehydrogenase (acetyl-transferring), homodimeric type [Actinomycetes bacterium]
MSDHNDVTTGRTLDQLPDPDPRETRDWLDSLTDVVRREGVDRARFLLRRVLEHAGSLDVGLPQLTSTDYVNTVPASAEPPFPGDEAVERRLLAIVRWNAAAIVSRANKPELSLGGHMASYASAAELFEVGFNHFFRGKDDGHGDQIFFQGHSSPGVYARAFLEGRLTEEQLDLFRQETRPGGLSSYPHPRLAPEFWEFPTVSMGLGAINAIYQARFNRYLAQRGIVDTSDSRVWAFLGDGEMDEPEAIGALSVAARDELDNLTFVINCNLQRLDGPVRGNGKIAQELEALFRGAGWNVVKVLWGRLWDPLLERDTSGALVARLNSVPDGELQTLAAEDAAYVREHLFDSEPLRKLVDGMSDEEIVRLSLDRGGHDIRKVHAAYKAAVQHRGQPTVVIAQSIKGRGLGPEFEARNATHQMKKFVRGTLHSFRDRLGLDIPDEQLAEGYPPYYRPPEGSDLHRYLIERRRELGGPVPRRLVRSQPLELPGEETYARLKKGSGRQPVATTMALVRLVRDLLRHSDVSRRIVPIIPDEARTFGMDSLFPELKIYSVKGMNYDAVDRELVLSYKEDARGQVLHEGITEAGSMSEFHAAGSSYATFAEPMIPLYIFYSMFGFQRTGDLMWSAADQRCKGFLIGATAGRTTLNGEGLQHQDGHSLLLASTNPACVAYDPSFAFEIPAIVEDALHRMYGEHPEDLFYYLTVYNEPFVQPPMPDGLDERQIVQGLYRYRATDGRHAHRTQIVTSGSAMPAALRARELLASDFDVAADVWSAPGWQRLRQEALECEEWNRMHPTEEPRVPLVNRTFAEVEGPVVAVTDFMRAIPDQISRWVPRAYAILGTDGFGRSDTRPALRRYFKIDAENIAVAVLQELALAGELKRETVAEAIKRYDLDPEATTEVP